MRAMLLLTGLCCLFNLNCGGQSVPNQLDYVDPVPTCIVDPVTGDCQSLGNGNDGNVTFDNCGADEDCASEFQHCVVRTVDGEKLGRCVNGCTVEKETQFGTSCRIAGTDSCQREGDDLLHCDESNHTCRYLTEEEQADGFPLICEEQTSEGEGEGSEGEGEGADIGGPCTGTNGTCEEPIPGPTEIKCCWSNVTTAHLGQFSWSTSRPSYPEAWAPGTDRPIGTDGCASFSVALSTVAVGFWCDVTTVPRASARGNQWLTTNATLRHAYVGGVYQTQSYYFEFGKGWRFGQVGGHDPGCYYGVGTCQAPGR